jgi:broad specificity phosphatase PhoE
MDIYVVRHGLSEGNEKLIFQGWIDFPLVEEGKRQAEHLGRFFHQCDLQFDRIVTSSMVRAQETAQIITDQLDGSSPAIEIEDAFKEIYVGDLEGVKSVDVETKFSSYYNRPPSGWFDFKEFGGESWEMLTERVDSVIPKYIDESKLLDDSKMLIVAHGASMRAILRNILKNDDRMMFIRIQNCTHFKVSFTQTRKHLRRYIAYFMPLTSVIVDGKPYHSQIDKSGSTPAP